MLNTGIFKGWLPQRGYGFIRADGGGPDIFLHVNNITDWWDLRAGAKLKFDVQESEKGLQAINVQVLHNGALAANMAPTSRSFSPSRESPGRSTARELIENSEKGFEDALLTSEEIEELDTEPVVDNLLAEIAKWKREARSEDSARYFWHVREVDQISQGEKYFVIGRKGSGKTAICEHFNSIRQNDVFAEKLSFKNFPFNELYLRDNQKYTSPNQFITIWKYLIYSTLCRLLLRNQSIDENLRTQLAALYDDKMTLSRRLGKWVGREFGLSLLGLSVKVEKNPAEQTPVNWTESVDFLEDLLSTHAGDATYYILFDELDEDYRDVIAAEKHEQYVALITSLFKAVQDVRTTFNTSNLRVFPVIFLRDDIYDIVKDSDKNKWGDFKVDLSWDQDKIRQLIAFRISRALSPQCRRALNFDDAWRRVFGARRIGIGSRKKTVSTFDFICRSTLLRPRDFVIYLQNCAHHATTSSVRITPEVVRYVDKAFSNYLRQEMTDELFAVLPDIANIFDAISQLRKWNFSIPELEKAYGQQVEQGFIREKNVNFVLQVLFNFSVIGNMPYAGRYVFRYQNNEARLNFRERVVVHRGLFKALQIL